ncbi:MAG: hypothetical protein HUU15_03685 [Candidatus Brocadiae bacterium]|nr:hypothetical protein [Candidatus Brocadiia bacterium]
MKQIFAVLVLVSCAGVVAAQTEDKKRIDELERRIQELEAGRNGGTAPANPEAAKSDTPTWKDLVSLGGHLKWYGFLRLDTHYSDSAFDNARFPQWVRAEDDDTFIAGVTAAHVNDDQFNMHARLTRLGLDLDSGKIATLGDASATGKLEIDFFSLPSSESRAVPRLRHAYGKIGWSWLYLLFGQTSDLVSPLAPSFNPDTVLWNWGNTGDRRPQIRIGIEPTLGERFKLLFQVMAGQEGAIRNADLDGIGVLDGDDSGYPEGQARVGVSIQGWVAKKWMTVAFGAMYGEEEVDGAGVGGKHRFHTSLFCLDFEVPLLGTESGFTILFKGEIWHGTNLSDIRGGNGQGINAATGHLIRSNGGWLELRVSPVKWLAFTVGSSQDDPIDRDFTAGMREKVAVTYAIVTLAFDPFVVEASYGYWKTEYEDLERGTAHQYNLSLQLNF